MSDTIWSGPAFSVRRLAVYLCITAFVVSTDALFLHVLDVTTPAAFATEVVIHTLGFYGGFTLMAVLD